MLLVSDLYTSNHLNIQIVFTTAELWYFQAGAYRYESVSKVKQYGWRCDGYSAVMCYDVNAHMF